MVCFECKKCQTEKNFKTDRGEIDNEYIPNDNNETFALDIKGQIAAKHFKTSKNKKNNYFYILTMVDLFSRYTETRIIWRITSKSVIKAFKKIWIKKTIEPQKIVLLTMEGSFYLSNLLFSSTN
ncbi:hypothetical protein DMUE_6082 [Dictyocoela muelleri]|nr:hypothetical protein DMUE_6082 [Dictyocoela muelleri]